MMNQPKLGGESLRPPHMIFQPQRQQSQIVIDKSKRYKDKLLDIKESLHDEFSKIIEEPDGIMYTYEDNGFDIPVPASKESHQYLYSEQKTHRRFDDFLKERDKDYYEELQEDKNLFMYMIKAKEYDMAMIVKKKVKQVSSSKRMRKRLRMTSKHM